MINIPRRATGLQLRDRDAVSKQWRCSKNKIKNNFLQIVLKNEILFWLKMSTFILFIIGIFVFIESNLNKKLLRKFKGKKISLNLIFCFHRCILARLTHFSCST